MVSVTVTQATPSISTAPTASSIEYGQTLNFSTLSGGVASVEGTFAFTTPSTAPSAGTANQDYTFTPTDTTNYKIVTGMVSVTVTQATPSISTAPTASSIEYGQTLNFSTLSGGVASVEGTFAFTTPSTAPSAGTANQDYTFTPTDTTNYTTVTGTVSVTVTQATPSITTPPTASSICLGNSLASSTLSSGLANVSGSFSFTSPSTNPNAGTTSQEYTFTPTDTINYNTVTGLVSVTVNLTAVPTTTSQTFCTSGTIANLVATGTNIQWYDVATDGNALTSGTALVTGTTYYASQTVATCESTRTAVTVTVNPLPVGSASAQAICSGLASSIALNSTITGTTFTYTAALLSGTVTGYSECSAGCGTSIAQVLTNTSITNTGVVRYTVTPTSPLGCVGASFTVDVTVNPLPTPAISGTLAFCEGGSSMLDAGAGYASYNWSTGATTQTTSVSNATTVYVTVTNAAGCATITSAVVEVLPAITITEHPVSTYICSAVGSTALLSVATSISSLSKAWQYRVVTTANPNPSWITITSANAGAVYSSFTSGNLVVTKTATLPAIGTQYRVLVTDSCNRSTTSNLAMLSIITTVKAGAITGPASVCLGSDMKLVVSGYSGTSLQWQSAASATGTFANIAGATSDSYTIYGATADVNKSYRVIVFNSCNATSATTAVKTIVVNPTTVAGTITGAGTVCTGGGATLKLVSNVGTTIQWKYSVDGVSYTNVPTTTLGTATSFATTSTSGITATYIVTNVTQSTWFKATVKSGLCNTEEAAPVQVIVGTTVAGNLSLTAGSSNTICSGTATSLTLSGYIGTITWQKSENYYTAITPTWTAVTGTTATMSTGVLTNTTTGTTVEVFRANVTLGTCSTVSSIVFPVNILPAAKGGTVAVNNTSGLTVCSGGSKELKVTGYVGSIQWQKSTTSATATDFTNVNGATTSTYNFDAITQNTWFRVVAKNGDCVATALSNALAITVSTPVTVGTITAATNDLCPTNTGTTLTLAGSVGTISWAKSTDNGNTWTTVTGTTATLATGALPVTTTFRAKLISGSCVDYSTIVVTVKPSTIATVSATASTICSGLTTRVTVVNYGSGTIQWQKATTLTGTYANVTTGTGITSATYVTPALTATTYFRAIITNTDGCSSGTTGIGVTVNPLAVAKTITGSVMATSATTAICTTASQTLTIGAGSIGENIQWQWSSTSEATGTWTNITNANSTTLAAQNYVPVIGAATSATYFRFKITNSCSSAVYSAAYSVYFKNCAILKTVVVKEEFNVIAYPNPYTETFNLSLKTSSSDKLGIVVYDMTGRLIERREVKPSDMVEQQIGDSYPTGVYNVVVTQGEEVRTLRVVKR